MEGKNLSRLQPGYLDQVRKLYTHQASPMLTNSFLNSLIEQCNISKDKIGINVVKYGNRVTTSTLKLLDDDLKTGVIEFGDKICISLVGAGPERGAFIIPVCQQ
jgi:3-oxoacyl-[acyl-carrier-protein] synthase-3